MTMGLLNWDFKNANHVNVWQAYLQRLRNESVSYWGNWKSVQLDGEIKTVVRSEAGN